VSIARPAQHRQPSADLGQVGAVEVALVEPRVHVFGLEQPARFPLLLERGLVRPG
jgi:hypothetical protein